MSRPFVAILPPGAGVRLVCTACGWADRVPKADAASRRGAHVLLCVERLPARPDPSSVRRRGRWTNPPGTSRLPRPGPAARCSTCGERIRTVNGTRSCDTGCTYAATSM